MEALDDPENAGRPSSSRASSPQEVPPIPLQTYLWEDVRRERLRGGYPWTHFVKEPFDPNAPQEILQYDRSPGSKRKYGSLDVPELDESPSASRRRRATSTGVPEPADNDTTPNGDAKIRSKSVSIEEREQSASTSTSKLEQAPSSPRSILKHYHPEKIDIPSSSTVNGVDKDRDSPKETECCHPLVDKLKTIADKNILKSPRAMKKHFMKQSPKAIKKLDGSLQEIITLDDSPSAERRKRDLEKVTFEKCSPSALKRQDSNKFKDHIYESIEDLPSKSLSQSESEKELHALSKSLRDTDQDGKEMRDPEDLIGRDSLTRSLDQYLKEELMETDDKGIIDSKNQILKDILKRIADENDGGSDSTAPLSKMDSEEDDTQKAVANKMPVLKEDDVEGTSSSRPVDGDKCLVIDITETVEEEIVDFVVLPDEDQDIGELPEPDEIIDLEDGVTAEKKATSENATTLEADEEEKYKKKNKDKLDAIKSDGQGRWSTISDHEYESIGDPDSENEPKPAPKQSEIESKITRRVSDASSTTSGERRQLQGASSSDMDQSHPEEQVDSDREITVQEMQQQIEDKYFKKTEEATALPTIQIESPDVETNIEQEMLQAKTASQRGKEMQKRLKAQAGRLKTKFKDMKKPSFSMPERKKAKITEVGDPIVKSKTSHMPKISIPEFKMPDRPKMSMPQFKMPDRPKFKMPERPRMPDFKMPERPKMPDFKMLERPKMPDFKMPDRPKMPDFKMPSLKRHNSLKEPTSSESTAESKKRIAFDFRTYPRIFSKKTRDEEYVTSSPKEERTPVESATIPRAAARKKGPVGARWVNRFADIKFADDGLSDAKRGDFEDRLHRLDEDYKQMQQEQEDDEEKINYPRRDILVDQSPKDGESFDRGGDSLASEEYSGQPNRYWEDEEEENEIRNRDLEYGVRVDGEESPLSNQEERGSSGDSYERQRRGVLEEIDDDEFFLRQRGISQDDIEVGRYLSSEIRDAFKTPVNALEQLGAYDGYDDRELELNDYSASRDIGEDDDVDMDVSLTPLKPERTRSLRKHRLRDTYDQQHFDDKSDDFVKSNEEINGFNTFSPNRPRRQKKSKKTSEIEKDIPPYNVDLEFNDENDRNLLNRSDIDNFDRLMYENEMMEGKSQPDILVIKPKYLNDVKRLYENEEEFAHITDAANTYENEENLKNLQGPPMAPKRKRKRSLRDMSASSEPGSMINAQFQDDWPSLTQLPHDADDEVIVHRVLHEYVIPLAESEHFPSPTPPRRTRSRSLVSRTTTAPDEDRTSHGAESLISDNNQQLFVKDTTRNVLDMRDGSGYAVVKRQPSVPKRRKRGSKSAEDRPGFNTTPRRAQSSPKLPPRGISEPDLRDGSPDVTQYEEVDDEDVRFDELQSGDIVSKMKDRPLPPPPRPPRAAKRKKKKERQKYVEHKIDTNKRVGQSDLSESMGADNVMSLNERTLLDRLQDTGHRTSTESFDNEFLQRAAICDVANTIVDDVIQNAELHVENLNLAGTLTEEIEMWTQTDPMPDDFVCEDVELTSDTKFIEPTILKDGWKETKQVSEDMSLSTLERNKDDSRRDKSKEGSAKLPTSSDSSRLDPLDIERARKIADAESLSRGLRRFRESSRQRTFSSSRTPSERAMSEQALLLERTLVTPTKTDEILTEATLLVRPVYDDLDVEDMLEEQACEDQRKYLEETNKVLEDISLSMENANEAKHEEGPPIPRKRRSSLKKSRPMPIVPTEGEVDLSAAITSSKLVERAVDRTVVPTSDSTEVEILKTNRLHVSNLDVETLNVSQLQANSIRVSEIDGVALQVKELNSKSGNLVVSGIDIAPAVLQDILDKISPVISHATEQMSTQTEEQPADSSKVKEESVPERPPPPVSQQIPAPDSLYLQQPYMQPGLYYPYPASIPPASFYSLRPRDYSEDEVQQIQSTLPRSARRRHAPKRESTSEEDQLVQPEMTSRYRRPGTKSPEPSVREISGQLARACCSSVQRMMIQTWNVIKTNTNTEERKREIQIALIILLVFTAGLIMIGLSDKKTVHHHHWEFFNPPSDKNT